MGARNEMMAVDGDMAVEEMEFAEEGAMGGRAWNFGECTADEAASAALRKRQRSACSPIFFNHAGGQFDDIVGEEGVCHHSAAQIGMSLSSSITMPRTPHRPRDHGR